MVSSSPGSHNSFCRICSGQLVDLFLLSPAQQQIIVSGRRWEGARRAELARGQPGEEEEEGRRRRRRRLQLNEVARKKVNVRLGLSLVNDRSY